jgi:hypothetical protein
METIRVNGKTYLIEKTWYTCGCRCDAEGNVLKKPADPHCPACRGKGTVVKEAVYLQVRALPKRRAKKSQQTANEVEGV